MVISCRFSFSFDAIMHNYTVYDAFANPNLQKNNMAYTLLDNARSDISLRVAAKTRTKHRPAIYCEFGEKGNMALLAEASSLRENKHLHCFHGRYIWSTYQLVSCLLLCSVSEIKGAPCARCTHFQGRVHDFRRCAPGVCTF